MPVVEVTLPDRVDTEIDGLVDTDEFISREQALEELLSVGISAYGSNNSSQDELDEDLFSQTVEDQSDPAMQDGSDDDYSF